MSERIYSRIAGTGSYLPEKVLTNDDLSRFVDTSDEWIRSRTGIRERHVAADGQTTGDLGVEAARRALEAAGVDPGDLDLIVVGTTTPDLVFPSTACLIQARLGAWAAGHGGERVLRRVQQAVEGAQDARGRHAAILGGQDGRLHGPASRAIIPLLSRRKPVKGWPSGPDRKNNARRPSAAATCCATSPTMHP